MKVITLQQPWAELLACGNKKWETRSWNTKYRGEILIHSSAKIPKVGKEVLNEHPFNAIALHLVTGHIIGKAELYEVVTSKEALATLTADWPRQESEYCFGNYDPDRYVWKMRNHQLFKNPIPAKGKLGIWNIDIDLSTFLHMES